MRRALALCVLLAGCPQAPEALPVYPWDDLRPAIAAQLPWSTVVIEPVPCGFDPGDALLALDEGGGAPLLPFLHARAPKHYQRRLAVFRPSYVRPPVGDGARVSGAELAGWVFGVDGATLAPLCQAPLEARVPAAEGSVAAQEARWRAAFEVALSRATERLRYGGGP